MNNEDIRAKFKSNPSLKRMVDWLIMNQVETRPRWFIRLLAPLYQHRGKHAVIHRSARMDTPPYRKFYLGDYSVVESFACINNAVGDVIIGDHTWISQNVTLLKGANIGDHSVVGFGSVCSKPYPDNCIIAGVPGTVIKHNIDWDRILD
jgi:acetyltransferase-like isoleucine patch superfamily enzyme